jgi:transcriptional regulator with XRE-family HTH domain
MKTMLSAKGSGVGSMGARISEERSRLGMTQAELAAALGLSRNSVSLYEADKHLPGAEVLLGLHQIGVDVLYVLTGGSRLKAPAEAIDTDRLALSLEEARRQMDLGKDGRSQREILERALPIYQALGSFLESGDASGSIRYGFAGRRTDLQTDL